MSPFAWMAEQLGKTDLPGGVVPSDKPQSKPRGAGLAIRQALDRTWRSRPELARLAGCDETTAGRVLGALVQAGIAEVMERRYPMPKQFRRVR